MNNDTKYLIMIKIDKSKDENTKKQNISTEWKSFVIDFDLIMKWKWYDMIIFQHVVP